MRQTLLRILFADPWAAGTIVADTGLETYALGAGWVVLGTLLSHLVWLAARARHQGNVKQELPRVLLCYLLLGAFVFGLSWRTPGPLMRGVPIFGYGVMVFLGFAGGLWSALRRASQVGLPQEVIWDLLTYVFAGGVGGARLFYLVQYREKVFANLRSPGDAFFRAINLSDGGLVLLGGVLLACLAIVIFCYLRRIPVLLMADLLVPSFFIGLACGRLGCLLNGCCFGDRCELGWAIHFPAGSVPWGVLVQRGYLEPAASVTYGLHPTQVYSSITAGLLALLTATYFRYRPYNGAVLIVGMLLYPIKRIVMEFLRGDELGQFGTQFTVSQWVSAGIFLGGIVLCVTLTSRRRSSNQVEKSSRPGFSSDLRT